ncbi:TonB family protein [Mesorhizobium sp. BE184]|uniref:energy transducer TonB family protein n=1 Tax=Mesorhizobium sp. BE184 TaxID=2817714 RepID=UPI00285FA4CE|nr:TonB family protein [Mesorhizobium sp. BE184]MDR7032813.1 protein TonB [Mesorhizobium sp. BE184]
MPPEPDDPVFAIPRGALQPGMRDAGERIYIADTKADLSTKPSEPLHAAQGRTVESSAKWKIAIACSLLLHAAVAWAFLSGFFDNDILIEGSDQAGVLLLGNAPQDQASTSAPANEPDTLQVTLVPMVQPKPVDSIEALPVEVAETVQPVEDVAAEVPVAETVAAVEEAPAAAVPAETIEPMPTDPRPQILSAETVSPLEDNVVQPPGAEQPVKAEVSQAAEPAQTDETIAPEPEPKLVEKAPTKPVEKPKRVEKRAEPKEPPTKGVKAKPAKTAGTHREKAEKAKSAEKKKTETGKTRSGSHGENQADSKRGVADGKASGKNTAAGKSGRSAAGNAAVSNYPGKVAAKLRRAMRSLSRSTISKARRDVRVSFTVNASGGLSGVGIASSSGSPDLDQAALAIVRRAAPFPPIPPDAGRSSWSFTLPLGVK